MHPIIAKALIAVLSMFLGALIIVYQNLDDVQAAAPTNIVNACTKIATTGEIDYFYCEPDYGPSFVANSVGFVALEQ